MKFKTEVHIPTLLWGFIVLYLFWALWKETPFAEMLYTYSVYIFAIMALLYFGKAKLSSAFLIEIGSLSFWCLLMYLVYNFAEYSTILKRTSVFGFNMDSHSRIILYIFLLIVPGIVLSQRYKYSCNRVFRVILFFVIATSLFYSLRAVVVFPDALRARSTAEYLGYESVLFGTPSYSAVYSMSLLAPWLFAKASYSAGRIKLFYYAMLICVCVIVAISQFATALLALVLGLFIYWFMSSKASEGYFLRTVVLLSVIMLFTMRSPIVNLLISISEIVSGAWADKLVDIAEFISGAGAVGDVASRTNLYKDSWEAFGASPILGMLTGEDTGIIGGHSTLFDMLALVGLFGTFLFVVALYHTYKRMKSSVKGRRNIAAVNAACISYIFLLSTKNIITAMAVNYTFFVFLPILFSMKESAEDEYEESRV